MNLRARLTVFTTLLMSAVALTGCNGPQDVGVTKELLISDPPPMMSDAVTKLRPPATCPAFAPGHSDTGDETLQWLTGSCAVDEFGLTYGIDTGDRGSGLAVLPGDRELGIFFQIPASFAPPAAAWTTDGAAPAVEAWAAQEHLDDGVTSGLPESSSANRIAATVVAAGSGGLLLSLGHIDAQPIQVAAVLNYAGVYDAYIASRNVCRADSYGNQLCAQDYAERFYVNGQP